MAYDNDELYEDDASVFDNDDQYSELGPEDSASQIGRAITTEEQGNIFRGQEIRIESSPPTTSNGTFTRPTSRPEVATPTTPPSRRTSLRSSRLLTPTRYVPSRQDRFRYSWQSINQDEPNRPRIHVIKIVSHTATASAGLPGGEHFGFSISPGGRRIVCYNSTRLFVLQTAALPVNISQEYALRRRPLAVEVVDEGGILAVLADEHTINVYDVSHHRVQRLKTFRTDYPAYTIALSHTGGLLAAAYEGGVEVFSLAPAALSTDRRATRAPKMDRLAFSDDGSTLLGTTTRVNISATVIVSVPVFPAADNGVPTHDELKEAWCTNILEPENINNSSHATFMRESGGSSSDKLFAWNGTEDTFGILATETLEYNNVDFPVTISPPLSTVGGLGAAIHSAPALDEHGETVAMVVNDRTIRLYTVPQVEDEHTKVEAHSIDHELDEEFGCPFTDIRWVFSHANLPAPKGDPSQVSGRLVIVSPGGVVDASLGEESVQDIEGGRIILFDFDPQYSGQPGQTFTLTLGKAPPQMLHEKEMDVAEEIALVRRRTVNQSVKISQRTPTTLGRSASTAGARRGIRPVLEQICDESPGSSIQHSPVDAQPSNMSARALANGNGNSETSHESSTYHSMPGVAEEAIEEPYDHNAPRSVATLQRAASAATSHRIQQFHERAEESATARDSGYMTLPQYTEEPNTPLPGRYRAMAGLDQPRNFSKATRSPRTNEYTGASSPDMHSARPLHDNLVSAQPTIPEDAETPHQGPYTPPRGVEVFANGNLPRSLQRAYGTTGHNLVSPVSTQNGSAYHYERGWQQNNSPSQSRQGHYMISPMASLQALQPASMQAGMSRNQPNGLGIAQQGSYFTTNRYSDRGQPHEQMEQQHADPGPQLRNSQFYPQDPIIVPSRQLQHSATAPDLVPTMHNHDPRRTRNVPPHVSTIQDSLHSSSPDTSSSLFPPNPNERRLSTQPPATSITYPITAWSPPAPSLPIPTGPPPLPSEYTTRRSGEVVYRPNASTHSLPLSLYRAASAPGDARSPSRAGTIRSTRSRRGRLGGRRTPKYHFDAAGGEWVEDEGKMCVVM